MFNVNIMDQLVAIYGLRKYLPEHIIKSHIIPFSVERPELYCKNCDKVLYVRTVEKKKILKGTSWVILHTSDSEKNTILCMECFRFLKIKKQINN